MITPIARSLGRRLAPWTRCVSAAQLCRWCFAVGLASVLTIAGFRIATAGDDDRDPQDTADPSQSGDIKPPASSARENRKGQLADDTSFMFRAGIIEGQGISQNRSLVPIELFPYVLSDDSLLFADLRFFSSYELTLGGNAGFGYRQYFSGLDRIFGISGWYDADHVRENNYFQQVGLSLESYGKIFDFRANLYLPVGETFQQSSLGVVPDSTRFSDENVLYDQLRSFYSAMKGLDMEAGVALPGDFAEEHGIRIFGGVYHFEDDHSGTITGGSARLQANITDGLDAGVQVTNDSFYDTRAFVNLAWTFGPLHRSQLSQKTVRGRLGEHVTRNQTVVAPVRRQLEKDVVAVDPGTGQPYRFAHVDSAASPGGTGSVADPFQTIADAQASNRDIIFVHAGSNFSGADASIVMNPGDRILGDGAGIQHFIVVPELGGILLPHGPTSGSVPQLDSSPGDSVTLASNSEFSGFAITNPGGNGIVGNGVHDVLMHDVSVDPPIGDGIRLLGSTGTITLRDVVISGAPNDGLVINGGNANVQFSGTLSSNNGHDLVVENTTGGLVDMTGAHFGGSGSQGILIDNVAGGVNFKDVALNGPSGPGITIHGTTGNVDFAGLTSVSGADGPSIAIDHLGSAAHVTFDDVSIDHRHDAGMALDNIDGTVEVKGRTTISNQSGATASAIDVQNSSGQIGFGEAAVTDAIGDPGVNLENSTGTTQFKSLDVASNGTTALFAQNAGTLAINADGASKDGGDIHALNGTAIDIENTTINTYFTSVSSSNAPVGLRLVSVPGTFAVLGDRVSTTGSGGTIEGATTGILLQHAGTVGLASMVIDSNGVGIQTDDVDKFAFINFQLHDSSTYGLDLRNTRTLVVSYSNFSGNGLANVHADFSTTASYGYTFFANALNSATSDNIHLETLAGGADSIMNLSLDSNQMGNTHPGSTGLNVDWNGTLSTTLVNNLFASSAASNVGVNITNAATSASTLIAMDKNQFAGAGANYTGLHIVTNGSSQIALSRNVIEFANTSGTGMRFGLGPSASVKLVSNIIHDMTDGATGMLFDSLVGPSNVTIDDNSLQFTNSGALLDRGIIFSSVTDPVFGGVTYMPTLSSTANNGVLGADTIFAVPAGTTTGFLVINGAIFH